MMIDRRFMLLAPLALAACGRRRKLDREVSRAAPAKSNLTSGRRDLDRMIAKYAREYDVPLDLVHSVVKRESTYNPSATNGPYMGLMQIHPETARTMGYRGGPRGLLDADTNLKYGVKYLRGAWIVSGGDRKAADLWYQRGYYYEAKRLGLLEETGLR